jgi:hypothetical protein
MGERLLMSRAPRAGVKDGGMASHYIVLTRRVGVGVGAFDAYNTTMLPPYHSSTFAKAFCHLIRFIVKLFRPAPS